MWMEVGQMQPALQEYEIYPLENRDLEEVVILLQAFFYKHEPICSAINLTWADLCPPYSNEPERCIGSGTSLKAVAPTGKIVGVVLNKIIPRNAPQHEEHEITNPKLAIIDKYMKLAHNNANVFEKFPEMERILEIHIITVDEEWRKKGLANALIAKSRNVAIQNNCGLLLIHCTSAYSAKAAEKLGFQCIYSMKYEDFVGDDGFPLIAPKSPHIGSSIHVIELS